MKNHDFPQHIAFVYDRVNTPFGGAERVLLALHKLFPKAPLYTSVYDPEVASWSRVFEVKTSYLQEIPFSKQKHRELLLLMPSAFEHLDLSAFDLVISITSAEAKAIKVNSNALHICYLLTPTRYLWSHTLEYQTGIFAPFKALMFSFLRRWDYMIAQQPHLMIPISQLVKKRAEKYYRRKIESVIYPPYSLTIDSPKSQNFRGLQGYYLVVSRLVSYKKVALCIKACIQLKKPLVMIGDGPDREEIDLLLHSLDPQHHWIHWFPQVSDEELAQAYTHAKAFLLPAEEDFGITALEAQSYGKPALVYYHSGAAEVVIDKKTGLHLYEQSVEAIESAIRQSEQLHWDSDVIKSHTAQYNEQSFIRTFTNTIKTAWKKHLEEGHL